MAVRTPMDLGVILMDRVGTPTGTREGTTTKMEKYEKVRVGD